MINAIIIDDEPKARESLALLIEKYCPDVLISGQAGNFEEGYVLLQQKEPQLVFADVQLHSTEGSGLDLLSMLELKKKAVIFTSGWKEYAVDAFRLNAVDYLLKPINIQQLKDAVEKAKKLISENSISSTAPAELPNTLHIPTQHGFIILRMNDIVRCEAEGPYTHFFISPTQKKITSSVNLGQIEKRLNKDTFCRVHKSHIVNRAYIVEYQRGEGGIARMSDNFEAPVSRNMKEEFLSWLEKRTTAV